MKELELTIAIELTKAIQNKTVLTLSHAFDFVANITNEEYSREFVDKVYTKNQQNKTHD